MEDAKKEFYAAYDALLARWPVPVFPVDIPSEYGMTHVNVCGPHDGEPLVLLHSGSATSTVWFNNVGDLARTHRVFAVDHGGRSEFTGKPLRNVDDVMAWLDGVCTGLGLDSAAVCGHSYGSWFALNFALHAPDRVRRLALLDPTNCFAGLRLSYRLHAVPLFLRPGPEPVRRFMTWETGGAADPDWLTVTALQAAVPGPRLVWPRQPAARRIAGLRVPVLVVLAGRSRAHSVAKVAAQVRQLLPDAVVTILPDQTHHTIPFHDPEPLNQALLDFLP
jgi:pimeloyl-ACP methyl ester carboxylesterase